MAKIYTVLCSNLTYSVPHSACNATNQCIILYFVCNLHNMCDYTHLGVTQSCVVYIMCLIFTEYVVFAPIHCYAAFTLSVCSFTHFVLFCVFFIFTQNHVTFYTYCV